MIFKQSVALLCYNFIVTITALPEGSDCVLRDNGEKGKCINIHECENAKEILKSGRTPQLCGFNNNLPLVCCLLPKSIDKCYDYYRRWDRQFPAFYGEPALPKEFPHMAAVGYGNKENIRWFCGGTLISQKFVLTAAHCTFSKQFGEVKWVRLGDLNLDFTGQDGFPKNVAINYYIVHPDYRAPLHYHDIALLNFNGTDVTTYYRPACLNREINLPTNKLQATGWGQTEKADHSDHLIKVNLTFVDYERCRRVYSRASAQRLPNGILNDIQLCAGDDTGIGKDTCPGDSGGPLHYFKKTKDPNVILDYFVVVGITSFGKICGLTNTAGVYTRVSAYVEWIESIVWANRSDL